MDEADNLYGFSLASGHDPQEIGKSITASSILVDALTSTALEKNIPYEIRVCHHLENYQALRTPNKYPKEQQNRIKKQFTPSSRKPKT